MELVELARILAKYSHQAFGTADTAFVLHEA
jgi:hypothetical protein